MGNEIGRDRPEYTRSHYTHTHVTVTRLPFRYPGYERIASSRLSGDVVTGPYDGRTHWYTSVDQAGRGDEPTML